jgi:hypothetical protein
MKYVNKKHLSGYIFMIGLIFVLVAYGVMITYLYRQNRGHNVTYFANIINRSIEAESHPAPVDAQSGMIYFSHAHLMLPEVPIKVGPLNYFYESSESGDAIQAVHISRAYDVNASSSKLLTADDGNLSHMMRYVPKAQACIRGITMSFSADSYYGRPTQTKKLTNGKTLYIYTEPSCLNQDFVNYAKKVDSY